MDWKKIDDKNIRSAFQLEGYTAETNTSWTAYHTPNNGRIQPLHGIDQYQENLSLLMDSFTVLGEEQKKEILPLLTEWMANADAMDSENESSQVRDFIYEMF